MDFRADLLTMGCWTLLDTAETATPRKGKKNMVEHTIYDFPTVEVGL